MFFGKLNNRKIFHIINENRPLCHKTTHGCYEEINEIGKHRLCRKCEKKYNFVEVSINDNIYYIKNNSLYDFNTILKDESICVVETDGNIKIDNYRINLISINKKRYYLLDDMYLYEYDNRNIFECIVDNNIKLKKLGRVLGPDMAIINRKMEIINKLKYNVWKLGV